MPAWESEEGIAEGAVLMHGHRKERTAEEPGSSNSQEGEYRMTRVEFLKELRAALENNLSGRVVQENVAYYEQYISEEVQGGRSEEEVLQLLGDPWILARTIIDAVDGTDQAVAYEQDGDYSGYGRENGSRAGEGPKVHVFGFDTWWKKLLLILVIVMLVLIVVAVISGLVKLFAPVIILFLAVSIIGRMFGNRRK